jgi:superfamily I DNA/RNA helicase
MIPFDRWQPSDGLVLEPNALLAAREKVRSQALSAGPGSGKTEMLAQRADFLLRTGVCRYPQRILAISFKVDATRNLKARVRQRCGTELASRFDSYTFHAFAKRIIDRFRLVLTGRDALDADYTIGQRRIQREQITFQDLAPLAQQILELSSVARNAVRQTYSHVFMDEFQDCTTAQYDLVKAAFLGTDTKLTAVGDTKQRIMGWAGALEGIFESFALDFNAKPLSLYQNFRSAPKLRRMQNAMVRVMDEDAAFDDEDLPGSEGVVEVLQFSDSEDEAAHLANLLRSWIEDDEIDPSEIAVLVSKQLPFYCDRLQAALIDLGVPFRNEDSNQDLAAEPIAALIVDFLLVIAGQRQPRAYRRLVDIVLFDRSRWNRFVETSRKALLDAPSLLSNEEGLRKLVFEMLDMIGRATVSSLSHDYKRGTRLDDLIQSTLARVQELVQGSDNPVDALAQFSGDRAVRIMSIHKSKGLEFDRVVVLGVEEETFWGEATAERSAFFVAISRAKQRLYLTVTERRARPAGVPRWSEARTPHEEFLGYAE